MNDVSQSRVCLTSGDGGRSKDVAGKLIGPGFERGQFDVDTGASVFFGVVGHVIEGLIIAGRGQSREKSLGVGRLDAGRTWFQKGKESVIEMGTGGVRRLVP